MRTRTTPFEHGTWPDRNSKFHRYDQAEPTSNVETLLSEIDADPTCIFWG